MDMSFARRRKAKPVSDCPDLPVLLAEMSARQGSSRTARVQSRLQAAAGPESADPLLDIFAPVGEPIATTHSFSDRVAPGVNRRQPT